MRKILIFPYIKVHFCAKNLFFRICQTIKSISARRMFQYFPKLKKTTYWGGIFWSGGYYVGFAGSVSSETIKKYIERLDHT